MDPPSVLIAAAPPSEIALLDFARAPSRVSREMIHEIALNDREQDVSAYELGIFKQLAPNPALGLITWISIGEVLWLEQVAEPTDNKGHWKRLFACTILLRNVACIESSESDDVDFFIELQAGSVIQVVRSAIVLGSEPSRLAVGFLLWLHGKQSDPLLRPFVSFGVLLLQIQEDLTNLPETCAWVEEDERLAREQLGDDVHSTKWLVGLNYQEDSRDQPKLWADTFAQAIATRSGHLPPEAESALRPLLDRLRE